MRNVTAVLRLLNGSNRFHSGEGGKCCLPLETFFPFPCASAYKKLSCLCLPLTTNRPGLSLETSAWLPLLRNVTPAPDLTTATVNPKTRAGGCCGPSGMESRCPAAGLTSMLACWTVCTRNTLWGVPCW